MERYYLEFECPLFRRYKRELIPFALKFYKDLTKSGLEYIKIYIDYLKPYYNSNSFLDIWCMNL